MKDRFPVDDVQPEPLTMEAAATALGKALAFPPKTWDIGEIVTAAGQRRQ